MPDGVAEATTLERRAVGVKGFAARRRGFQGVGLADGNFGQGFLWGAWCRPGAAGTSQVLQTLNLDQLLP